MAKIKRKCSKCERVGHNKATCKNKAKKRAKKKVKKKTKKKKATKKVKKKAKKKITRKKTKKKKRKSTTRSTGSRSIIGRGRGWKVYHFSGRTKKGNTSNKTWAIKISGKKVWTHHGKTWGIKSSTPKVFSTTAAAKKWYRAKLAEKRRKHYCLVGANRRKGR